MGVVIAFPARAAKAVQPRPGREPLDDRKARAFWRCALDDRAHPRNRRAALSHLLRRGDETEQREAAQLLRALHAQHEVPA